MAATTMSTMIKARSFVDDFNDKYATAHLNFEEQFWGTKMALEDSKFTAENLAKFKKQMEDLMGDPELLKEARALREGLLSEAATTNNNNKDPPSKELMDTLDIIIRTCECNEMTPNAKTLRQDTSMLESKLEMARNQMKLGYQVPEGEFVTMSSVGLRNLMRTSTDEAVRKAAYEGLCTIGPFVCDNGFVSIVKKRNQMAKDMGFVDYYDYKVSNAEGFSKAKLFEILDTLEEGTRPLMEKARAELVSRYGPDAVKPWNTSFMMAGSVVAKMDPYFPFGKSVERYMQSYAAMGISYQGATLNLDLLDRPKKYSNGFCHWPVPAWRRPNGDWQASTANFTSLADPSAIGSGLTALRTLMHEAGHAAHFANIKQPSPLFSQERAPTSVAYAENQSMFLDSLVSDAAWRAKYARNAKGEPIPFEIIEEGIRSTHPFAVSGLRAMLAVSYFEKALYELPEEEVTAERIQSLATEIELKIQGGQSPRPLLSVPHIVSDEASCYYQGYTLAEMSVYQTREYFLNKYGFIVDNPKVGPELTEAYWKCGNGRPFLDLVKELTGKGLTGTAWTNHLQESVDEKIASEQKEYEKVIASFVENDDPSLLDTLDMTVRFVDGDDVIADSKDLGLLGACKAFEDFVAERVAKKKETAEDKQ